MEGKQDDERGRVYIISGPDAGGKTLGARVLAEELGILPALDVRRVIKHPKVILAESAFEFTDKPLEDRVYDIHPSEEDWVNYSNEGLRFFLPKGTRGIITAEPTGVTPDGILLRQSLTKEHPREKDEILRFTLDRGFHLQKFVNPLISRGVQVIIDRSLESTLAYQAYAYVKKKKKGLSVEDALAQVAERMNAIKENPYWNGNRFMQSMAEEGLIGGVFVFTASAETLDKRLAERKGLTTFDREKDLQAFVRSLYAGGETHHYLAELERLLPGVPYVVIDTTDLDRNGRLDAEGLRVRVRKAVRNVKAPPRGKYAILPEGLKVSLPEGWTRIVYHT